MGALVVFYSRSGTARRVAEALARDLGAELEGIVSSPRGGALGFMRCLLDVMRDRDVPATTVLDPADYDHVVVGGPVWAGRPAAPLRAWLRRHRGAFRSLSAFCVSGSGGAHEAFFTEVESLAGRPLARRLSLAQRDVLGGRDRVSLHGFADALQVARA